MPNLACRAFLVWSRFPSLTGNDQICAYGHMHV